MKRAVILNPVAGGGKALLHWQEYKRELERQIGEFELNITSGPNKAVKIAQGLAMNGCDLIVAAGGDGTISEVADGILRASGNAVSNTKLGILPCGTGSDLARSLRLDGDSVASVARLARGKTFLADAGRVSFCDFSGKQDQRHFINVASLGLSGPTAQAVNATRRSGKAPGKLVFLAQTVLELLKYRFQTVRVTVDEAETIEATIALVAAGNARYFGGGMMIAPDADMEDGLLDVVIFRGGSKLGLIRDLRLLYTGDHKNHRLVTILRGRRILVEPGGDVSFNTALVDVDGEAPGTIPAVFEILPKAIRIVV